MGNEDLNLIKRIFKDPYTTMSVSELIEDGYNLLSGRDRWKVATGHEFREDAMVTDEILVGENVLLSIGYEKGELDIGTIYRGSATFEGMYGFSEEDAELDAVYRSGDSEARNSNLFGRFQLHSPYFQKGFLFGKKNVEYPIIGINIPIVGNKNKTVEFPHIFDIDRKPKMNAGDISVRLDSNFFNKYKLFQ